ncbi:MAG: C2H2-type zinc finger protein [Theionarchaea archaeon]|nr:C2H2-type zinc finger protein [Theionarchaea archaeon]
MIRVDAEIHIEGRDPHVENLPVSSFETAEQEIKNMVEKFNNSRLPGEKPRKFIRIISSEATKLHNWKKISITPQCDSKGYYDLYKCEQCGLTFRRRSLNSRPPQTECYPERTCKDCQKVFVSERNLQRHIERVHADEDNVEAIVDLLDELEEEELDDLMDIDPDSCNITWITKITPLEQEGE